MANLDSMVVNLASIVVRASVGMGEATVAIVCSLAAMKLAEIAIALTALLATDTPSMVLGTAWGTFGLGVALSPVIAAIAAIAAIAVTLKGVIVVIVVILVVVVWGTLLVTVFVAVHFVDLFADTSVC